MLRLVTISFLFAACSGIRRKKQREDIKVVSQEEPHEEEEEPICPDGLKVPKADRKALEACGVPVFGKLIVGCKGANDLHDADGWGFGKSDPYCRVRLSDSMELEARGSYNKFRAASETMKTESKKDNLNPQWNEVFEFTTMCPQHPDTSGLHKLQLEVTIKDEDWLRSSQIGNVYIPFDDIINRRFKGDHTLELQKNMADQNDTRVAQGTVNLYVEWCPLHHTECIQNALASAGSGRRQETQLDCDMSCNKKMTPRVNALMSKAKDALFYANSMATSHNAANIVTYDISPFLRDPPTVERINFGEDGDCASRHAAVIEDEDTCRWAIEQAFGVCADNSIPDASCGQMCDGCFDIAPSGCFFSFESGALTGGWFNPLLSGKKVQDQEKTRFGQLCIRRPQDNLNPEDMGSKADLENWQRQIQRKWTEARNSLVNMRADLTNAAYDTCGRNVLRFINDAWDLAFDGAEPHELPFDYSWNEGVAWSGMVGVLQGEMSKFSTCLETKWWEQGEMLPNRTKLTDKCGDLYLYG